jgi:LuxR family maltose regulon positive regulatory protein
MDLQSATSQPAGIRSLLAQTKLRAPPPGLALVQRKRLVAQLTMAMRAAHRLSLVTAPAGYGKTTLVGQWARESLDGSGAIGATSATCVAWLSLEPGDNSMMRIAGGVLAALAVSSAEFSSLGDVCGADADASRVALLNAVAAYDGAVAVVLDDAHCLTEPGAVEWLHGLIERMPDHMHLVVIGREQTALPVGRLRAMGRLTEVSASDLSFTRNESAELLNAEMNLGLSEFDVATLAERTEGWGAGLKLAGLALQSCEPAQRSAAIARITGSHRFIRDYLGEEVFARQDECARRFLLDTSLLELLTPELCDAVTGRADSAQVLERLVGANAFILAIDGEDKAYRYHHMFSEFLSAQLRHSRADSVHELQRRSLDWRWEFKRCGHATGLAEPLSEREREVVQLLVAGLSNRQIAQHICVAPGTVKRHVHNIFSKLNARSRADVIAYARHFAKSTTPMYPRAHDNVPG